MGLGYLIAISTALLLQRCVGEGKWLLPPLNPAEHAGCCSASPARERRAGLVSRFFAAVRHACEDFFDVGKFLFLGAFVASLARALTSIDVTSELMSSPLTSIIAMMFLAVVLNVCSEADAFIAAGFNGIVPGSAQMAFMLLGPILDLKLLFMYSTIFRKRFLLTFSAVALLMVLAGALFVEVLLGVLANG